MVIDKKFNLVIPIDREDGKIYVHSIPISREIFERHFLVFSKTFAAIYGEGLGFLGGPRIAALLLRKVATDMGLLEDIEKSLIPEINRLTCVLAPGPNGWQNYPWAQALAAGIIDDDDKSEVENAITFFIVASAMHKKTQRKEILEGATEIWGGLITLLAPMEFVASLTTSTEIEPSMPKAALSVPS